MVQGFTLVAGGLCLSFVFPYGSGVHAGGLCLSFVFPYGSGVHTGGWWLVSLVRVPLWFEGSHWGLVFSRSFKRQEA